MLFPGTTITSRQLTARKKDVDILKEKFKEVKIKEEEGKGGYAAREQLRREFRKLEKPFKRSDV